MHTFYGNSELRDCSIWWNPGNPDAAKCPEVQKDFIVYATLHHRLWLGGKNGKEGRDSKGPSHTHSKAWKLSLVLAAG